MDRLNGIKLGIFLDIWNIYGGLTVGHFITNSKKFD